jgi:transposase-like protein
VERPRVRSADYSAEVRLRTYDYFADRDPLTRSVLERMLAGVSTRRYRRTQESVGQEVEQSARSTSRSAVSRTFIERTRGALRELMSRRLDDVRLAVMMIDGLELQGRTNVVALGISTEGVKIPLGLWEGSTENATVATALLSDLVERGLDPEQGSSSWSTAPRRCAKRSATSSARRRCSVVSDTRNATRSTICPSVSARR